MKNVLKKLALGVLSIVLFLSITGIFILIPIKSNLNNKVVKEMITDIDLEKIMDENYEVNEQVQDLLDPVLEETRKLEIDDEVVIKVLNSSELKSVLGDLTAKASLYLLTGEKQKLIDYEDVNKLINQTLDDIEKSGIYNFSDSQRKEIANLTSDTYQKYEKVIPDSSIISDSLDAKTNKILDITHFILGNKLIMYLSIISGVSILFIVLLRWKELYFIKSIAKIILTSSIVTFIIFLISSILSKHYLKDIISFITIISKIVNFGLIMSICLIILMIAILISYHFLTKTKKEEN